MPIRPRFPRAAAERWLFAVRAMPSRAGARVAATTPLVWAWLALAVVGTGINVYLRSRVPFTIGLPSGQDALLFIRQATALHAGNWLGPFDGMNLAKGPAYPAFMVVAYALHVGLGIADQLAWLFAAATVGCCVRVAVGGVAVPVLAYLFVGFDPAMFNSPHSEVYRDSLYQSLSLAVLALWFLTLRSALAGSRPRRWIPVGALAGLTTAAFWLCREEGLWLAPALAVLTVALGGGALWRRLARRGEEPIRRATVGRWALRGVAVCAVLGGFFALPVGGVMLENHHRYGVALTNDVTQGQFPRAFAQWTRVEAGPSIFHVPITRAMRAAVYQVSPAAAELQVPLESPTDPWLMISCRHPSRKCDLSGSFTPWALRHAAAVAGHLGSEPALQTFFGQIADQISRACADGQLRCRPSLPTGLQPFLPATARNVKLALGASWHEVLWSAHMYDLPRGLLQQTPEHLAQAQHIIRGYPSAEGAISRLASFRAHLWPYDFLIRAYHLLGPLLALIATIALLGEIVWWRRGASALVALGLALAVGVASRLVLFAFVGATQYGVVSDTRYHLPTHGFLLAYGAIGTAAAFGRARSLAPQHTRVPAQDQPADGREGATA